MVGTQATSCEGEGGGKECHYDHTEQGHTVERHKPSRINFLTDNTHATLGRLCKRL
jgi:hypothetical protein